MKPVMTAGINEASTTAVRNRSVLSYIYTHAERVGIATMVTRILAGWNLSEADQLRLLGLCPRNYRSLDQLPTGSPLPGDSFLVDDDPTPRLWLPHAG